MSVKKYEKARIKAAKADGITFFSYPGCGATVVFKRTGKGYGDISWTICSFNDVFKKRAGKIRALNRFYDGVTLPIRWPAGRPAGQIQQNMLEEMARQIANQVG